MTRCSVTATGRVIQGAGPQITFTVEGGELRGPTFGMVAKRPRIKAKEKIAVSVARADHEETLLTLVEEFYAGEHLTFDRKIVRQALRELFADPRYGFVFLISADKILAGYIVLTFGFSLEFHGRDAFVDEFYLRPAHRGRGLGRAALRHVEKVCRQEKIKALHLEVDRVNTRAQAIYHAAGYRDHDRYLLTKFLSRRSGGR